MTKTLTGGAYAFCKVSVVSCSVGNGMFWCRAVHGTGYYQG
jgi:hypothetical protein